MNCRCPEPREGANPRTKGECLKCGRPIGSDVLSSDQTIRWFFDRLEQAIPAVTSDFLTFRRDCEAREKTGRDHFGIGYLSRDNTTEAQEEAADGANYFFFEVLKHRRETGRDDDLVLALQGAWHAYQLHRCATQYASRLRGSP